LTSEATPHCSVRPPRSAAQYAFKRQAPFRPSFFSTSIICPSCISACRLSNFTGCRCLNRSGLPSLCPTLNGRPCGKLARLSSINRLLASSHSKQFLIAIRSSSPRVCKNNSEHQHRGRCSTQSESRSRWFVAVRTSCPQVWASIKTNGYELLNCTDMSNCKLIPGARFQYRAMLRCVGQEYLPATRCSLSGPPPFQVSVSFSRPW
jgi:hypothetical protein